MAEWWFCQDAILGELDSHGGGLFRVESRHLCKWMMMNRITISGITFDGSIAFQESK
ncbi:hypothetical protein DER46DRAFT_307004 [Fusarium sp. MPI-SDFR-AT-0072]|nr:hypothetical protein DER46DRAFT_307004 [Fusarium sp. MPI-SDFR-AT-0072]